MNSKRYIILTTVALTWAGTWGQQAPIGLKLQSVNDQKVSLTWSSPEAVEGYWEDFESHADFAINSPGEVGWQYIDGDNRFTSLWNAGTFPGQGSKMAYIVFNGSEMSLVEGLNMADNKNFQPTSGQKMLVDFSSIGMPNNDYLISPELSFDEDFQISFQARSYTEASGKERVRVGYSTTGCNQSDFTFVTTRPTDNGTLAPAMGQDYLELPAAWTLIQYNIPAEAKYVCVNCISNDAFIFMLDDLFVGVNHVRPDHLSRKAQGRVRLAGFNVWRDGERVNDQPVVAEAFTDEVSEYGQYLYAVSSVYTDGSESAPSTPIVVNVGDISLLPFEEDFHTQRLDPAKWSTPADLFGNESRWAVSYYEYGLVNFSAQYGYSSLRSYNHPLVTRVLHTLSPENTWLRFTVQLVCYRQEDIDYLDVEVKGVNEMQWHNVATLSNQGGPFDRTTFEYDLSSLLTNVPDGRFQVQFRAHGADAQYIDYWYLDDIKVWNPMWSSASINVTDGQQPLSGIDVELQGEQGAHLIVTTDEAGRIDLPQIEMDTYQLSIHSEYYNSYNSTFVVGQKPAHTLITLQAPRLELSAHSVEALDMATESAQSSQLALTNRGTGSTVWSLDRVQPRGSGQTDHRFELGPVFNLSGDLQSSIVFDGTHYYTSSWYFLGKFYQYDRDGRFIEEFSIPGMYYMVYDFAYDGRYVYASDYSNRIFQLDMDERRIVSIITIEELPKLQITHLAYDPDRDGFWCGTFNTLVLVNRQGVQQSQEMTWQFDAFGSAYDNVTPGGPYLWVADMNMPDDIIIDKIMLSQYNLNTRSFTGLTHVVNDVPGYRNGSATMGQNQVCGVTMTDRLIPGQLTLVGLLQQSPSLVYTYNICDFDTWYGVSPQSGVLAPGESQQLNFSFNSMQNQAGFEGQAHVVLHSKPQIKPQTIDVTMHVTHNTATPRPKQLQAVVSAGSVQLTWEACANAQGYRILRDGSLLATVDGTQTSYSDRGVVFGDYVYSVLAFYAEGGESLPSDAVSVTMQEGAPFYAPLSLEASLTANRHVTLHWQSPTTPLSQTEVLGWGTGENADQLGSGNGEYFYAGQRWTARELETHRNKTLSTVSVRICTPVTYLAARVYQNGKLVARQVYSGQIAYGEYTDITLSRPVTIQPGSEYIVAIQLQSRPELRPLGMDDDTSCDGKGNLLSLDGVSWYNASQSAITGNFNLRITLEGAKQVEGEPSTYRVYCDGRELGNATGLSYTYDLEEPGEHDFTVTSLYAREELDGFGESRHSQPARVKVLDLINRQAPVQTAANVERNRLVSFCWAPAPSATLLSDGQGFPADLSVTRHTERPDYPAYLNSWTTNGTEMAVACDGKYVYTSVYNETGRINVYTLQGQYLGRVSVIGAQMGGIRNLAWDGSSLWAADNSNNIHRLSLTVTPAADGTYTLRGSVAETFAIPEYSRHLAYVPELDGGRGGFETGDWNTSIFVNRQGAKLSDGPALQAAAGTAWHNGLLYAFEQGNPLNAHCVGVYDVQTRKRLRLIDLEQYVELDALNEAYAGGASTFVTADGITVLALCMQFGDRPSRLLFLDVSGSEGVTGYNVYRDGQQLVTDSPSRFYSDTLSQAGTYNYQVATCFVDGSVSALSAPRQVTIVDAGVAKAPVSVQAVPMANMPYNVSLSFADPDLLSGAFYAQDFESGRVGQAFSDDLWLNLDDRWAVTDEHYFGQKAIMAGAGVDAWLFVPAQTARSMNLVARAEQADPYSLQLYYSRNLLNLEDFVLLDELPLLSQWQSHHFALPEDATFLVFHHPATSATAVYLDAFRLDKEAPVSEVYGYYLYRDGELLNQEPLQGITYVDHNLQQGIYTYEVRSLSQLSALSEPSAPATITLDYDNGGQAPVGLRAEVLPDSSAVQLTWDAPALGADIDLAWHNGHNFGAAGLGNGGAYWAGVRWAPSDLQGLDSLSVCEVEVYVNQVPDALYVLLYEGGELKRQQFVPRPQQYAFNRITLDEPLRLNTQRELRLVVYVEHNEITVPLGYDAGPCVADGKSNIYSSNGVTWNRLSDEGTEIDANWNFGIVLRPFAVGQAQAKARQRAAAAPQPATAPVSTLNALRGYSVYVNRESQHFGFLQTTSYTDAEVRPGIPYLEYQVKAVYTNHGEVSTPVVRIQNPMQTPQSERGRVMVDAIEQLQQDLADAEIRYNLQGQRVRTSRGITITRQGVESYR